MVSDWFPNSHYIESMGNGKFSLKIYFCSDVRFNLRICVFMYDVMRYGCARCQKNVFFDGIGSLNELIVDNP